MRLSQKPLQPWVILKACGEVDSAHCTCMAGVAEKCSHVSAVLFKIDATVRKRGFVTPTDVGAYWVIPPNVHKVQGVPGHSIDFTTSSARKKMLEKSLNGEITTPPQPRTRSGRPQLRLKTIDDISPFLAAVHQNRGVLCSVMKEYAPHYVDPVQPCFLPKSLLCLRNTQMDVCDFPDFLTHLVSVTDAEADSLEKSIRLQYKSDLWHRARAGRITASNIHRVVATSITSPARSTVMNVCYPQKNRQGDHVPEAIKWGREQEDTARVSYIRHSELRHRDMILKECGFVINPSFPELSATPDALVHCTCCGNGCVEIKCPFKHRENTILQACTQTDFCLQLNDGNLEIKKNHPYYKQIQTQMFVTRSKFCDFVVWTTQSLSIVHVTPDVELWEGTLLPTAQQFFYKVVLPELVACHFTQQSPLVSSAGLHTPHTQTRHKKKRSKKKHPPSPYHTPHPSQKAKDAVLWCTFRQPKELDDMVACDNQKCSIQWFHLGCVGLSSAPGEEEPWLCDTCMTIGSD